MNTVLITTVGGSHQPVEAAIKQHRPQRIWFLCSADRAGQKGSHVMVSGPGLVTRSANAPGNAPDGPNLLVRTGFPPDQAVIHTIEQLDDLEACYCAALAALAEARDQCPNARIIVDYTAGTKSMSAGLALAAVDDGECELCIVSGSRNNLIKVPDRTEVVRRLSISGLQARRRLEQAAAFVDRYDYSAAELLLREAAALGAPLSRRLKLYLTGKVKQCGLKCKTGTFTPAISARVFSTTPRNTSRGSANTATPKKSTSRHRFSGDKSDLRLRPPATPKRCPAIEGIETAGMKRAIALRQNVWVCPKRKRLLHPAATTTNEAVRGRPRTGWGDPLDSVWALTGDDL